MKEYKRLTNNNRDEYDTEYDFCCDCKYFGESCGCNRPNGTCGNYDRFIETYNRLAELKDKIENRTLVEIESPCTEEELERELIHIEIQNMIRSLSIPGSYYSLHKPRQKRQKR